MGGVSLIYTSYDYARSLVRTSLMFLLWSSRVTATADVISVTYYANFGQDIASPVPRLQSHALVPSTYCALACNNASACGGFNYHWPAIGDLGACDLLNGKPDLALLVSTAGVTYFENMNYDECSSDPCQNGATCTDGFGRYTCVCVAGYQGVNCETNIDECASGPCQHGSACVDELDGYICQCLTGYSGTHCEICPVMKMGPNCDIDCMLTADSQTYTGTVQTTENGKTCQRWDSNSPHIHLYHNDASYPVSDAQNYCRNPDSSETQLWCFTTNWVLAMLEQGLTRHWELLYGRTRPATQADERTAPVRVQDVSVLIGYVLAAGLSAGGTALLAEVALATARVCWRRRTRTAGTSEWGQEAGCVS